MDRKLPRYLRLTLITAAAVIFTGSVLVLLWLHGAFLPRWIVWNKDTASIIPEGVRYRLSDDWLIQNALRTDIDGCGEDEAVLLVWKRGSYGNKRPTWVKHNDIGFSQHIFIYKEQDDVWRPIWMSSGLNFEAADFREGEEIAGTKRKSLDTVSPDGSTKRWGWLSWGLIEVD